MGKYLYQSIGYQFSAGWNDELRTYFCNVYLHDQLIRRFGQKELEFRAGPRGAFDLCIAIFRSYDCWCPFYRELVEYHLTEIEIQERRAYMEEMHKELLRFG